MRDGTLEELVPSIEKFSVSSQYCVIAWNALVKFLCQGKRTKWPKFSVYTIEYL